MLRRPSPYYARIVGGDDPGGAADPRPWRALLSLTLLALATRFGWFLLGPKVIENEGVYYARVAENLASGRGYISVHEIGKHLINPPLYSWLISLFVRLGANAETAGRALSMAFGAALPAVLFLYARRLYGARAAWCAGVLAAVFPVLIVISTSVLTESLYFLLSVGAVWCFTELLELRSWRPAVGAGALMGLAYLTRPEAFIFVLVFAAALVAVNRERRGLALRRAGVVLAVFAIFALPYVHYLYRETGQVRFEVKTADGLRYAQRQAAGQSWGEIYFAIDKDTLEEQGATNTSDRDMVVKTHATTGERVRMFVRQGAHNLPRLLQAIGDLQLGQPAFGVCVVLGFFGLAWDRERLRHDLFLLLGTLVTLLTFCTWPFFHDRYMFPLLPAMMVWAGVGLERIRQWSRASVGGIGLGARAVVLAAPVTVGVCVFFVCVAGSSGVRESDEIQQSWMVPSYQEDVVIGRWLRGQGEKGEKATQERRPRIMDTGPLVSFYGDGVLVPYPWTDAGTALRYIDHKDVDYLIVRDVDAHRRPYLADWLREAPARFDLVQTFNSESGAAHVYRWRKPDASLK
jgi:4-amino-4-deoxy-L-arabinose transferase-like glycosyltransferase